MFKMTIRMNVSNDFQRLFGCNKFTTLKFTPFESDFILSAGIQRVPIAYFEIGLFAKISFYFLDCAGELLFFNDGNIEKVSDDSIKEVLTILTLKIFNNECKRTN